MNCSARRTWEPRRAACTTALIVLAAGCTPPGKPDPADRPQMSDQIMDFEQLFTTNCGGCHGADGRLGPAPPLNDSLFLAIMPNDDLLNVIRDGRPGTLMPPFRIEMGGSLTDRQIDALANEIKSNWSADNGVPEAPPPYTLSKTNDAQLPGSRHRGEQVFARACAGCHGANGVGGGHGPDHQDQEDHEHAISGAINEPSFLALVSNQAIRRIIITGRPDLGMPNYAENDGRPDDFQPLTSAEIDDLVALIAGWRTAGAIVQSDDNERTNP